MKTRTHILFELENRSQRILGKQNIININKNTQKDFTSLISKE